MQQLRAKVICLILTIGLVSLLMAQSPSIMAYVEQVKDPEIIPVSRSSSSANSLEKQIKEAAETYSEPPIDARIDSVWKAIPGYNGLIVDEERTLRLAQMRGVDQPLKLVFYEKQADFSLSDLPPSPIYRGNERKPMAALMINVAWGTEHLQPMLDILRRDDVRATFFLDGSWLAKHPDAARQIVKDGHEIGNHAYTHPQMSRLTVAKMRQEIEQTEKLIEHTLGVRSRFFAPPSGDFNERVVHVAAELDMFTVLWTADTVDWRPTSTPQMIIQRVRNNLGNGMLVLMHPTDRTVAALPEMIRMIEHYGLKLGTVSEVLSPERVNRIEPPPLF